MKNVMKVVFAVLGVITVIAVIVYAKKGSDNNKADLGKAKTVIDEQSGITWEMYGDPVITETTSTIGTGLGEGTEIEVRRYTIDHGSWTEVVQIFDVPPGEVDFTDAALTTYDAGEAGVKELGKVEFIKIGGIDAASGTAAGQTKDGDEVIKLDTVVFATQMQGHMVTGGVAQEKGDDAIDLDERATTLRNSIHEA